MSLPQTLLSCWKFCLSFRKPGGSWELSDYPIAVRELCTDSELEQRISRSLGQEIKLDRYLAQVIKWWVLSGGGPTVDEAKRNLAVRFEAMKADRRARGIPMARPGTTVELEFAPAQRVNADPELAHDFVRQVLGIDWAFLSDSSSLHHFGSSHTSEYHEKIRRIYGVDVSGIESGNVAEILERIAASRRPD